MSGQHTTTSALQPAAVPWGTTQCIHSARATCTSSAKKAARCGWTTLVMHRARREQRGSRTQGDEDELAWDEPRRNPQRGTGRTLVSPRGGEVRGSRTPALVVEAGAGASGAASLIAFYRTDVTGPRVHPTRTTRRRSRIDPATRAAGPGSRVPRTRRASAPEGRARDTPYGSRLTSRRLRSNTVAQR